MAPIFPLEEGNFEEKEIEEISKLLNTYENLSEKKQILGTFGGHIHGFEKLLKEIIKISPTDLFMAGNWEYPSLSTIPVVTTEALMVGTNEKDENLKKLNYDKGIIRVVKILNENEVNFQETRGKYDPETKTGEEFIALNPYISWIYQFSESSNIPCVFLKSHPFTNREISSYRWEFGDGKTGEGKIIPLHCYLNSVIYNVTSTIKDAKTGKEEWITRKIEIAEGLKQKVIKIKNELIETTEIVSQRIDENLLRFKNYLIKGRDWLFLKIRRSPSQPVGQILINFNAADEDIDFSEMIFNTDINMKKSILYMPNWPMIVEEKILFIPK